MKIILIALIILLIITLIIKNNNNKESFNDIPVIIKGEKFQELADIYIGTNDEFKYNPKILNTKIKQIDINEIPYNYDNPKLIFCYTRLIYELNNKLDRFNNNFILITGNSDENIKDNPIINKLINNSKIVKWYTQNLSIFNDKCIPIPIGIQNDMHLKKESIIYFNNELINTYHLNKTENVFFNFNKNTNSNRNECFNKLKNKLKFLENTDYLENIKRLSKYKFCICPEGNGFDTHRLWECYYVQTIPIVLNTPFIQVLIKHINLPIVLLNSWDDFSEEKLNYSYNFDNKYYELLDFNYYKKLIYKFV